MISIIDSRVLDANSEALGVPVSTLMENAGMALSKFLKEEYGNKKIAFVCGTGNNGGDGFAAALNMDPAQTKVILLKKPSAIRSDISREKYSLLECNIEQYCDNSFEDCDVIVDCVLGTGVKGKVSEPYRSCIEKINKSGKIIVSADIPSGFNTDCAVKPNVTITFHDTKTGMNSSNCGKIIICDIGIPADAFAFVGPGDLCRYPIPQADSHKGQNGKLMIIGGGPYFGAPVMSGLSALRIGTDCVRIFTPESVSAIVSSYSPVFMVTKLDGNELSEKHIEYLLKESDNFDSVLIGPGLGNSEETMSAIRMFIRNCRKPLVVDADAISCLSGLRLEVPCVVTPHKKEYQSISEGMDVENVSTSLNAVILLKGKEDIIADAIHRRINRSGTVAMTGAGTGDVLSGAVAGLLSKGMNAFDSACLGAYICGKAGEKAFETKSYGLIATDVIDCIPTVLRSIV